MFLIISEIKINSQYADLVRLLSTEEYQALKNSKKKDGLKLRYFINQGNTIVDAHHRYKICQELQLIATYETKKFAYPLKETKFVMHKSSASPDVI